MYKCKYCNHASTRIFNTCPRCGDCSFGDIQCQKCHHDDSIVNFVANDNRCPKCQTSVLGKPTEPIGKKPKTMLRPVLFWCATAVIGFVINQYWMTYKHLYFRSLPTTVQELASMLFFFVTIGLVCEFLLPTTDKYYENSKSSLIVFVVEYAILISICIVFNSLTSFAFAGGLALFCCIFFHELGHYIVARYYDYDPKMVSTRWLYKNGFPVYKQDSVYSGSYTLAAVRYAGEYKYWIHAAGPLGNIVMIIISLSILYLFRVQSGLGGFLMINSAFNLIFVFFNFYELLPQKAKINN